MIISIRDFDILINDEIITICNIPDIFLRIFFPYKNIFICKHKIELFISFNILQYQCYIIWNYINNTSKFIIYNSNTIIDNNGNIFDNIYDSSNLTYFFFEYPKLLLIYNDKIHELKTAHKIVITPIATCCSNYYNMANLPTELILDIFEKSKLNPILLFPNISKKKKIRVSSISLDTFSSIIDIDFNCEKWTKKHIISELNIINCHITGTIICPKFCDKISIKNSYIFGIDLLQIFSTNLYLELVNVYYNALWTNSNIVTFIHNTSCCSIMRDYSFPHLKNLEINENLLSVHDNYIKFDRILIRGFSYLENLKVKFIPQNTKFSFPIKKLQIESVEFQNFCNLDELLKNYDSIASEYHIGNFISKNYDDNIKYLDATILSDISDLSLKNIEKLKINILQLFNIRLPFNLKILFIENNIFFNKHSVKMIFPYTLEKIYYNMLELKIPIDSDFLLINN